MNVKLILSGWFPMRNEHSTADHEFTKTNATIAEPASMVFSQMRYQ